MVGCSKALLAFALLVATPVAAVAQTADTQPAQTRPRPAPAATGSHPLSPARHPRAELLKPEQLDALVAPIALYPDALLANVLAASTYPLEVVQADRWVTANKTLKGDALKREVDKQAWDDSVKALAEHSSVLAMMSEKLDWTKNLGDAVLAQQPDVMEAIQRLRAKAQANNKLVTTKQQKVSVRSRRDQAGRRDRAGRRRRDLRSLLRSCRRSMANGPMRTIRRITSGYPPYIGAGLIAAGIAFGAAMGHRALGQLLGRRLQLGQPQPLHQPLNINNIGNNWQHNPAHRQGVNYNNANVAQRSATTI